MLSPESLIEVTLRTWKSSWLSAAPFYFPLRFLNFFPTCLKLHQNTPEFILCWGFCCRFSSNSFQKEPNMDTFIYIRKTNIFLGFCSSVWEFTLLWKDFPFQKRTIY